MDCLINQNGYRKIVESPIGLLVLEADEEALHSLYIMGSEAAVHWEKRTETNERWDVEGTDKNTVQKNKRNLERKENALKILNQTQMELQEYFAGKRKEFTVPVRLKGTSFQQEVWKALQKIPYGETRSYGQIAEMIGNPKACRAVGGANNRNPVMIIIPCHRVIGADGSLVGFGGGLEVKCCLLELERRFLDVSCGV